MKRRLMGLALSCSYLIFVVVLALAEAASPDPLQEKAVLVGALAVFVCGYVAFWWTSMDDDGWTCQRSPVRAGLALGLCAISVGLTLLHFQVYGYLLIYCGVVMVGILPPTRAWLGAVGVAAVTVAFILATGSR